MTTLIIEAKIIQTVAREKVLSGDLGGAELMLKESLIGIDQESINKILQGTHKLVNVDNGVDIVPGEDLDYIKFVKTLTENIETDEVLRNKIKQEKLLKTYQKGFFDFILHKNNERNVNLPALLLKSAIKGISAPVEFDGMSAIEQIILLLNDNSENNKLTKEIISEIKVFGFQFFSKFVLFKENKMFGRITGAIKTLEDDKASLKDTDILFLDVQHDISLTRYHLLIEKVGAVIAYNSMRSLLSHHDIFQKSKEQYEQIPLILIDKNYRDLFINLKGERVTIDFNNDVMSKKEKEDQV